MITLTKVKWHFASNFGINTIWFSEWTHFEFSVSIFFTFLHNFSLCRHLWLKISFNVVLNKSGNLDYWRLSLFAGKWPSSCPSCSFFQKILIGCGSWLMWERNQKLWPPEKMSRKLAESNDGHELFVLLRNHCTRPSVVVVKGNISCLK